MECYFGRGVQTVRQTMLRQEEIFQEQVCELHRLYNVQKLLMGELTNYDSLNLSTSNAQSDVLLPSCSSVLHNLGWQSSFWDSPANKLSDNTTQQLLSRSPKKAKSENDIALDSHRERSDSRQVARSPGCCRKLDLECLPDQDLEDYFGNNENGHRLEKGSKTSDASFSFSNMEGSQFNEHTDVSLCLGAGWGSSMFNQEMKQSGSFVSSLVEQGHGNDALKGLKRLRILEETITCPLYPTIGNSIQSPSEVPEETPKDERWGFSFETSADLEKSHWHKNQIRDEEPVKQERKFSNSEADEKLAKMSSRPLPSLLQVPEYRSKELERCLRLSSQVPTFPSEQGQVNNGAPTKLLGDGISTAVASPMISLGAKVKLGANALSIYTDTGSTRVSQKIAQLSSNRAQTNLWRDTGVLKCDTSKYDPRPLSGMQSGNSEECSGLAGQGAFVLDTNLSVVKGTIQETFSGLWPEWRKLSEFQIGQQKSQQPSVTGQERHFSQGHVAWLASRHPVSGHACNQGGTISASSVISLTEPSMEPASRAPDNLLRTYGTRESLLSHLTLLSASGSPKAPYVKDPFLSSLSQHRAGKELSSLSSASERSDPSFNGILEDYHKAVGMQIARIQKLEGVTDFSCQIPKFDTKEAHNSDAAKAEKDIIGNHTGLESKDNPKVGHNLREASSGGGSILFVSLHSEEAEVEDEVIESVQEASHRLLKHTFQNECTSMFILKDKDNKFHLPPCSSEILHEEKGLPIELRNFSHSFTPTDVDGPENTVKRAEPELQKKSSHARIPFNRLKIFHESSSLQIPKMAEKFEEKPLVISTECSDNLVMGLNQVQSSDELEPGDLSNPQSPRIDVSSLQGFEGYAEGGNIDNTTNIAACTLLSFTDRMLSIPKDLKNARELTPSFLEQSVAWFANTVPEDMDCQKCEDSGTTKSTSRAATSISATECGVVPSKVPKSKIAEKLWNQSFNKEFLRFLLKKLNTDINEDHTLDLKADSYEAMNLALKPSVATLNAINHYVPKKSENNKDTGNRTYKRAKKEKNI